MRNRQTIGLVRCRRPIRIDARLIANYFVAFATLCCGAVDRVDAASAVMRTDRPNMLFIVADDK